MSNREAFTKLIHVAFLVTMFIHIRRPIPAPETIFETSVETIGIEVPASGTLVEIGNQAETFMITNGEMMINGATVLVTINGRPLVTPQKVNAGDLIEIKAKP